MIAPDGGLYKCWVDIGKKDKKAGTIFEPQKTTDIELVSKYFTEDKFNDEKCLKCFIFPICSGLCPNQRFTSVFTDIKDKCPYKHKNIDVILEMLYEIMCKVKTEKNSTE